MSEGWSSLGAWQWAELGWLALLPVLLLLAIWAWRRPWPTLRVPGLAALRQAGASPRPPWRLRLPLVLEVLAVICLILAMARPQEGLEETRRRVEGVDLMLVLDLSGSMDAHDFPDFEQIGEAGVRQRLRDGSSQSRLSVAEAEIKAFVAKRPDDRLGLIAFGAQPITVSPPTLDHDFLLGQMAELLRQAREPQRGEVQDLRRVTGIAAALATGTARLRDSPAKRRVMVLFTDGRNNVEDQVTPLQAAKLAAEFQITLHTVGIGSEFAWVPDYRSGRLHPVRADFDPDLLRQMAEVTQGRYFTAKDKAGLETVLQSIDALEKTVVETKRYRDYRDQFPVLLWLGLALLVLGLASEQTVALKVP